MKVVIATPLYPPEIGGPATYVSLLERELPRQSIDVQVVKFSEVRHLPRLLRHYRYYQHVYRAAREADLVFALDPFSTGLPALFAAKRAGRSFVVKIVGDYAWEQGVQRFGVRETLDEFTKAARAPLPVRLLRAVQRHVARRAARVLVPSEYLRQLVETWGVAPERVTVIYNAVELPPLGEIPREVHVLARPFVVTAGRLVPWKHVDGVIDAVGRVPDLRLVVAGDGPERAALEARAKPLADRVAFTGQLLHEDLLAVLKAADALVLNSSYEGLSHLLVEAVLLGVPVIATRAGGNVEVIQEGENGVLVPVGDTDALVRALEARPMYSAPADPRFKIETMIGDTVRFLKNV